MTQHSSVVGGSTAARVIACPGSRKLALDAPPRKESGYAARGTKLHDAMARGISDAGDYDSEALELLLAASIAIQRKEKPDWEAQELSVNLKPIPGAFGEIDMARTFARTLEVIDFKFGQGVQVWPENNAQLMFYAAALLYEVPRLAREIDKFKLVIVQPNDRDLPVWREWEVELLDLFYFVRKLQRAVELGDTEAPPFNPGEHCRWCPANTICPTLRAKAEKAIATDPRHMTPAQLSEALTLSDALDGWVNQLYEYAHERMTAGVAIPGRKLVEKRKTRYWLDEQAAAIALQAQRDNGQMKDLLDPPTLKSPAQIEKQLKLSTDGLTEARSSGTIVVSADDKRPAFVPGGALKAFAETAAALSKRQRPQTTDKESKAK